MALMYRAILKNYNYLQIIQPVRCISRNCPITIVSRSIYFRTPLSQSLQEIRHLGLVRLTSRVCSTQTGNTEKQPQDPGNMKPGLIQRFKQMYRDYWYVVLPVHMVTSAVWFGSFYYVVRSGVDVIAMLESLGFSEKLMVPLRESKAGYFALAFACYKVATPLRYMVTIGGTTYAIRKLTALGWIKPVPSTTRIKEMIQEKKDRLQESKEHYQTQMKEKRTQVMDEMRRYKSDMRDLKNKIKKM